MGLKFKIKLSSRKFAARYPIPAAKEPCIHLIGGILDPNPILSELQSFQGSEISCRECRVPPSRRCHKKERLRLQSHSFWICLHCGRRLCVGTKAERPEPWGHARRHSSSKPHYLGVLSCDPPTGWCFKCRSSVPVELLASLHCKEEEHKNGAGAAAAAEHLSPAFETGCPVRGLENIGNTCFFNSVMQCLLSIGLFWDRLPNLERPLMAALRTFFVEMTAVEHSNGEYNPVALFACVCEEGPQYKGGQQQDSHEFLQWLLNRLRSEESPSGLPDTFVDALFRGELSSTISCRECGNASEAYESFLDLSVPMPLKRPAHEGCSGTQDSVCHETAALGPEEKLSMDQIDLVSRTQTDSKEALATSDSWVMRSYLDEAGSPCVQDSIVPLLPCKEASSNVHKPSEATLGSANLENMAIAKELVEQPSVQTASVAGCEAAEAESVLNDFNYVPESTSDLETETGVGEERDKVADINSPISVERCLYLYTKLESLPDDHECQKCSETSPNKNQKHKKIGRLDESETLKPQLDGARVKGSKKSSSLEADHVDSTRCEVIGHRKMAATVFEDLDDQDGDSCGVYERNFVECDELTLEAAPTSLPDQIETVLRGSCENDILSKVNQVERKGCQEAKECLQLMTTVHLPENSKGKKKEAKRRKVKGATTKRTLIRKAPSILTIHLMRFWQDANQFKKIAAHVDFQEILDLGPYRDPRCPEEKWHYRLTGVVEHRGHESDDINLGGHYVAYVRREGSRGKAEKGNGPTWYCTNDTFVREASLSEVFGCKAYILFYVRE